MARTLRRPSLNVSPDAAGPRDPYAHGRDGVRGAIKRESTADGMPVGHAEAWTPRAKELVKKLTAKRRRRAQNEVTRRAGFEPD